MKIFNITVTVPVLLKKTDFREDHEDHQVTDWLFLSNYCQVNVNGGHTRDTIIFASTIVKNRNFCVFCRDKVQQVMLSYTQIMQIRIQEASHNADSNPDML